MTISGTLFRAIVAMDSYNRGYDAGIDLREDKIGNATIGIDSSKLVALDGVTRLDIPASFYAVAYNYQGGTIISYRGTNPPVSQDIINGWVTGSGMAGSQAILATQFYKAVIGTDNPLTRNDVEFTGHSLGGGLAGFMGTIYGKTAYAFDNMPFELSAAAIPTYSLISQTLKDIYYFNGATSLYQIPRNVYAFATSGEALATFRILQSTPVTYYPVTFLDSYGGSRSPVDLHSQSLLVNLIYAKDNNLTDWHTDAGDLINALFNNDVAIAAGAKSITGAKNHAGDYADIMRTAIAYSAIDEGTRVFGDTGIRALFNDANEWGRVLKANPVPSLITDLAASVSEILTQFAGKLAIDHVLQSNSPTAIDGVLKLSGNGLDIEFGNKLWGMTSNIAGRTELFNNIFAGIYSAEIKNVDSSMQALWGTTSKSIFQDVILGTSSWSSAVSVTDAPSAGKADLFVGNLGGDGITGSSGNDLLLGYDGNDSLSGGAGNDILWGGPGNDSLNGGTGNDKFVINNGDGWDTIYYGQQGDRIVFNGTTLQGTAAYQGNGEYSLLGYKLWQHGYNLEITSPDGKTSMEVSQFFTTSNGVLFDTTNMGITVPGTYQPTGVPKTYTGTEKDDFLNIVGGPNIVNGLGGNDKIYVYYYSSTIDGGAGNDYISGSSVTDTIKGGLGDDVILSNGGFDTIHGDGGNDRIVSGVGGQKIFGDAGFDIVDYSSSVGSVDVNLSLTTSQEGGTLSYAYDDILSGIEGVIGSNYSDSIIGNSGNNTLTGGRGADKLTGGAGADIFKYNAPNSSGTDSATTATTRDLITDFANGTDKIDLSAFPGTLTFIGKSAFTAANQVNYTQVAGDTMIGVETNGAAAASTQIELVGLHTMTASDFLL